MAVSIGSVSVDVVPNAEGFVRELAAKILPGAGALGEELGQKIGEAAGRRAAAELGEGIEDGVRRSQPEREAGKKGRSSGGRFAREFKAEIEAALRDLPDIDVDAATGGAQAALARVRAQLSELGDKDIGVDISAADGIVAVRAIRAELESLRDKKVDVNFDIDGALASLGKLERKIADDLGGSFDRTLRESLANATRQLPEIQVNADTDEAQRRLAVLRADLASMSDFANINVDIDAAASIAEVERLSTQLQALVDDESIDIKIRIDAAAAVAGLAAVRNAADKVKDGIEEADREVGAFARSIRTQLEAAVRAIPDIDIDANTEPARASLTRLREEVAAFRDLEIGVDLSAEEALAGAARLIVQLEAIEAASPDIDVRSNAASVIAQLQAVIAAIQAVDATEADVDVEVNTPDPGAFSRKLRDMLAKAQATLPDIQVDGNTDPVDRKVAELRARLGAISANIDIDTDIGAVLADLGTVEVAARALDNDTVDIEIRADAQGVLAELAAIRAAAAAVGNGFDDGFGNNTFQKISRIRLILAAVIVLFPLVAGAVLGLAAAIALIVTPVAAIAAGLDGIQAALAPLSDELERLKTVTSQAFEQGLAPAVENVARLFPVLNEGLVGTAIAMSEVTTEVTALATESRNLDTISDSFDKINVVIDSLSPSIQLLSQNMIDLTNIGAQGLVGFGEELAQVGRAWADVIAQLNASGTAQAAIQALFQVLAELLNLLAPLTEFGAVLMASFGPAVAAALSVVGAAFGVLAGALDSLWGPMQTVVSIAITLRLTMALLGATMPTTAAAMGLMSTVTTTLGVAMINLATTFATVRAAIASTAFSALAVPIAAAATAFRGLGLAIRGVLLALVQNPIGLIIIGIVTALSFLGTAQSDAAAEADVHKQAIQELAGALRDSGGAIDSNIQQLTEAKLANTEAGEAIKELGLNQAQVANAVAAGGAAYDGLRVKLQALVDQGYKEVNNAAEGSAPLLSNNAVAAQTLLDAIGPLRDEFVSAAEANQQLAAALSITGTSMVGGLSGAVALEGAISTLGNAASTASDKAKALKDALDALNGGTVTAEAAAAKLEESIDKIGTAFEEAQAAAKDTGAALIDASGGIDKTTEAGRKLFGETQKMRDGMLEAASTAFEAAGGLNNVEAASAAAATKVGAARDAFIGAAREAGLNAKEAENLANRYGLIPELITTLLRAEGIPQVTQELQQVSGLLANQIPGTKTIRVTALSTQALAVLDAIGVKVRTLEDGSFEVTVDDQTRPAIEAALGFIESQKGKLPVDADADPMQRTIADQIATLVAMRAELPVDAKIEREFIDAQIAELRGQQVDIPVGTDPVPLQSQIPGLIGEVTGAGPADIPVGADGTAVPPAVAGLRSDVASVPAELTIEPGGMAFVQIAIDNIRRSVATPVNFSIGVHDNASGLITAMHAAANAPANFTVGITDNASATVNRIRTDIATPVNFSVGITDNATATINGIRTAASAAVTFTVSITDNASSAINGIRTTATTTATMPINADPAGANGVLASLKGAVEGTTASMHIDAEASLADGILSTFASKVEGTTSIMKIDADPALAEGKLSDLMRLIDNSTGTVDVEANTATAEAEISNLARPRRTTLTVDIVVNGQMPNAAGNILPANFSMFANGGMHNGKLSPMQGNYARIVQPNTFRVIGDRARDPEAYIPINQSPRSRSLLKITAAQMGYGLVPMATGGLLDRLNSTVRLASAIDRTPVSTQPGALVPVGGGSNRAVERKLDQLIQVLSAQPRGPQTITVEDRSGNPVETARATQLALRLAR